MIYFLLMCAILLVLVICRSCYENRHFIIKKYRLYHPAAKRRLRVVYLSDLHGNSYGPGNEELLDGIRSVQPDVILLGGDLIIGKGKRVETDVALEFLCRVTQIAPAIYTFGNHETRVRDREAFVSYMEQVAKTGVRVLNNGKCTMDIKGVSVNIYGLELEDEVYEDADRFKPCEKDIFEGAEGIKILLAHTPNLFEEYESWKPDFVFSGHNHGGIVRLFGRGVVSTEWRLFPAYSYGLYKKNETTMILSAGAGTHTIKFRLWNSPEIVVADISNEKEE